MVGRLNRAALDNAWIKRKMELRRAAHQEYTRFSVYANMADYASIQGAYITSMANWAFVEAVHRICGKGVSVEWVGDYGEDCIVAGVLIFKGEQNEKD